MRNIKFRAWNKEKNIMCYENEDNSAGYLDGWVASDIQVINQTLNSDYIKKTYDFMEFTELKDKNGKEIYEGDILRNIYYQYSNDEVSNKGFKEEILKVVYRGCGFIFEKIKINEIEMPEDFKEELIEVIGNIYENPELLEE